ncbi:MAG: hypothetical protein ACYDBV_15265 [Nitrospiria bacterium]
MHITHTNKKQTTKMKSDTKVVAPHGTAEAHQAAMKADMPNSRAETPESNDKAAYGRGGKLAGNPLNSDRFEQPTGGTKARPVEAGSRGVKGIKSEGLKDQDAGHEKANPKGEPAY